MMASAGPSRLPIPASTHQGSFMASCYMNETLPKTMEMDPLRFDEKVVLVTGAGNGLGRAYALDFAERGAKVVVNDLGGSFKGVGSGSKAADKVVEEIRVKGGIAVANYDSVELGDKVVQSALDNFGRIDVVVNNAGILRDKSFARISDEDWDIIQRVHLKGSFLICRAAWPHMKKQGYGRIIMVTSSSGIFGNFGQANYSAAKLGAVGLANTLALEGIKYNIHCNAVAPLAGSRMTATIMDKETLERLKPEYVTPLVVYLSHDTCKETGGLFQVGAGYFGKLRWQRSEGVVLREKNKMLKAETVRDNWHRITDFSKFTYPSAKDPSSFTKDIDASDEMLQENINQNDPVAVSKAYRAAPMEFSYTEKDAILYALGVGVSTSQPDYLKFLFEMSEDFSVIPTFAVIPAFAMVFQNILKVPGFKIDPSKMLHGEQYLELYKPLPRSCKLISTFKVADVLDKGSGLVKVYNVETFDENGQKVAFNQHVDFMVGAGHFGGKKTSDTIVPVVNPPNRNPDTFMEEKTMKDQAALYRLSGDPNPLHIDPSFAARGGWKAPILHGLCTFGHAVRHVMAKFANNDMSLFKAVKVRFVKPVLPGQTLRTEMWRDHNRIFFKTKIVETDEIVISGAYIDLHNTIQTKVVLEPTSGLKSTAIFKQMATQRKSMHTFSKTDTGIFQWNITQEGATAASWTVDLNANEIYEGSPNTQKADCTLTLPDETFVDLVCGKLDLKKAMLNGSLKISGNIPLAQKLSNIFPASKI
ncbi:hypothetical protein RRG08_026181 [Elysia crispata]|uniref:Peroxisomal multifunctional enzyme type 2 n=1 Tax=Elysia crispata TaxID=231223 RepID=A0AAE1DCQ8_9GAST|nr:hypothetical protein RRG08_026181 [Elysia crispata]